MKSNLLLVFVVLLLFAAAVTTANAQNLDELAARGEVIANADPLSAELSNRQPEGPGRRGFYIGMAAAEGQTQDGPGKQRIHNLLSPAEQVGFRNALSFSFERNKNTALAATGATIAKADPLVAAARTVDPDVFFWLGFDIATGIFGDPALGAKGNTIEGTGSNAIRDSLSAPAQRGFRASVTFHSSRRSPDAVTATSDRGGVVIEKAIEKGPPFVPPYIENDLKAEEQINRKWSEVRNVAGEPRDPCLVRVGDGYYRQYVNGRIYYRPGSQPFHVFGYIGNRYADLRGPESWLGWPTSDEQEFPEAGRVSTFEHGAIYWWADTPAIELGNIIVNYTGLYSFGETDDDQLSASDEPYVYFGVVPIPRIDDGKPRVETSAPRTEIYEEVDAGDSREDKIELYRGLPYGMSLSTTLFEHDFSDPNEYRGVVKASADKAAEGLVAAAEKVPVVGPGLAVVAGAVWSAVGEDVVTEIHELLDTKDDHIDSKPFVITAKQMVILARAKRENFHGIEWQLDSPLLSGDGSSYKVYFVIQEVESAPTPPPPLVRASIVSNDFNDDGRGDILWHNASTGESQIWSMCASSRVGRATIVNGDRPTFIGAPWSIVGSRDFNQDGKTDVLWYNASTGETQIWYMNGHKFSGKATVLGENGSPIFVGLPWHIVGTNDFNQLGKTDVLWHNDSTGETKIWYMEGHKQSSQATVLGESGSAIYVGLPWSIVGTNDFNQDGKADVLWHNSATNETKIWYMDGYKQSSQATVLDENGSAILVGLPWHIVGTNDFDQNGAADILWHNDSTGETQMWLMKGPSIVRRATVDAARDGGGHLVGPPWSIMNQ